MKKREKIKYILKNSSRDNNCSVSILVLIVIKRLALDDDNIHNYIVMNGKYMMV